jgi:hypothetical protein
MFHQLGIEVSHIVFNHALLGDSYIIIPLWCK